MSVALLRIPYIDCWPVGIDGLDVIGASHGKTINFVQAKGVAGSLPWQQLPC